MYLTLDLSSSCTGWAKFSRDGRLLKSGRIIPDEKLDPLFRLHYVVNKVRELFADVEDLVIEGIFLGRFKGKANVTTFEYLAKLSGAVIYAWISEKYGIPRIYKATEARKLAGLKGTCQKAEVQIWVIRHYGFADGQNVSAWEESMNDLKRKYLAKEISNSQFKYRAGKLSRIIDAATGIGEDIADSIVLGKAFSCERQGG